MVVALRKWLRIAWRWFVPEPLVLEEVVLLPPEPPPKPALLGADHDYQIKPHDNFGSLKFKGNILGFLGHYFEDLQLLRKHDPDSFRLYSRIGAQIINTDTLFQIGHLEPAWLAQRPSFGATYMGMRDDREEKTVPLNLGYYRKSRQVTGIEMPHRGEEMYEACFFYHSIKHGGSLLAIYVAVSPEGSVRCLRQRGRRSQWYNPVERYWSDNLKEYAETPQQFVSGLFRVLTSAAIGATAGIQILVKHNALTARFNIDMLRTPYFFADRDKVKGPTGATRRIFHIVRAHERIKGNKREVVHTHFKGIRDFVWNGYSVHISVPGLHHVPMHEFDVASHLAKRLLPGTVPLESVVPMLMEETA